MVWAMRILSRYFGIIARPLVQLVARSEIIACGLRSGTGGVYIIFSPQAGRQRHRVERRTAEGWIAEEPTEQAPYADGLVQMISLPKPIIGEQYRIVADGEKRRYSSPVIIIKETTGTVPLSVAPYGSGSALVSWSTVDRKEAMIFFLLAEDNQKRPLAGIYTREKRWIYPHTRTASLSIGADQPELLEDNHLYHFRLIVVDFDGWVKAIGSHSLQY